jgi:hypothetical protein
MNPHQQTPFLYNTDWYAYGQKTNLEGVAKNSMKSIREQRVCAESVLYGEVKCERVATH